MLRALYVASFILLPGIVSAAPETYREFTALLVQYINAGIGIGLALGFALYLFGIATNMQEIGQEGFKRLKIHVGWGIAALFVMFSVWGIVNIVRNTLFDGQATSRSAGSGVQCSSLSGCFFGDE